MFERSEISALILVTEVQTLSRQLEAVKDNNAYLQKKLLREKLQSSELQLRIWETSTTG